MFECNLWEQQNCSSFNPIVKYKNYFMLISLLLVTSSKIIENLDKGYP